MGTMICLTEVATRFYSSLYCHVSLTRRTREAVRCQGTGLCLTEYHCCFKSITSLILELRSVPSGATMNTILRARIAPNMQSLKFQPHRLHSFSRTLSCAAASSAGRTSALTRQYTVPAGSTGPDPTPKQKPSVAKPPAPRKPKVQPVARSAAVPELGHARHEVHEGTATISMPFNPPGGGPNAGGFSFTNSPVLDAILTTAMGIGAGALFGLFRISARPCCILNRLCFTSLCRRHSLCEMVQSKRPEQGARTDSKICQSLHMWTCSVISIIDRSGIRCWI
jgi:hypothetical protein